MIKRLLFVTFLLFAFYGTPKVFGQETPLTNLVPVEQPNSFQPDSIRKLWTSAPPAASHNAGVLISCPNSSAGSGIFVQTSNNMVLAVTNHHVIEGFENKIVDIISTTGQRVNAKVVWWDTEEDVAVLVNEESRTSLAVPVYDGDVPIGEWITVVAFGGPGSMSASDSLRPHMGRNLGPAHHSRITLNAYSVSGDSGSGYLYKDALVGVNWGHYGHPTTSVEGWAAGKPAASNVDGPWLVKTLNQVCTPYGCTPIIRRPGIIFSRPSQPYQPAPGYQPQPQPVEIGQPQPQPEPIAIGGDSGACDCDSAASCDCDQDAITAAVIAAIKADGSLKGEKGDKGDAGPPPSAAQLTAIADAITEKVKSDPSLKGERGQRGSRGAKGPGPTDEQVLAAVEAYLAKDPLLIVFKIHDPNTGTHDIDVARVMRESELPSEYAELVRDALQIELPESE